MGFYKNLEPNAGSTSSEKPLVKSVELRPQAPRVEVVLR